MRMLVTGNGGFIGFSTARQLLDRSDEVVGFDSVKDYYDVNIKEARLKILEQTAAKTGSVYTFFRGNLADQTLVNQCFKDHEFDRVIHLAAQAGVRDSLENPHSYVQSNVVAFTTALEACGHAPRTPPQLCQHQQRVWGQYSDAV